MPGFQVFVREGNANGERTFAQTATGITLNTTTITWARSTRSPPLTSCSPTLLPADVVFQSVGSSRRRAGRSHHHRQRFLHRRFRHRPAVGSPAPSPSTSTPSPRPLEDQRHAQGCDRHRSTATVRTARCCPPANASTPAGLTLHRPARAPRARHRIRPAPIRPPAPRWTPPAARRRARRQRRAGHRQHAGHLRPVAAQQLQRRLATVITSLNRPTMDKSFKDGT